MVENYNYLVKYQLAFLSIWKFVKLVYSEKTLWWTSNFKTPDGRKSGLHQFHLERPRKILIAVAYIFI